MYPECSVHPHACGEHGQVARLDSGHRGSPPRMWGTPHMTDSDASFRRFTPTHVGNTQVCASSSCTAAVHPHACGEHNHQPINHALKHGSPPRMWGTPLAGGSGAAVPRFTPTHVGNTHTAGNRGVGYPVHPHACGEHPADERLPSAATGSPPRMWGTRGGRRWIFRSCPVHPHACGEHCQQRSVSRHNIGSPPRMWGTRARC